MSDDVLFRFAASCDGHQVHLTVAELGALLTGLNRAVNRLAYASPDFEKGAAEYSYHPAYQEPHLVQLRITSVEQGSIEIQATIEFLSSIGLDPDTAKQILLNLIASALYHPDPAKRLAIGLARTLKRIAKGSIGKTIKVTIALQDRARVIKAYISRDGRVHVETIPPDDIQ